MRKKMKQLVVGLFAIAAACLLIPATQAKAYPYDLSYQTAQTENSATITWTAPTPSTYYTYSSNYSVYIAADYDQLKNVSPISVPISATSYTFSNLTPGTQYYFKVTYTSTSKYGSTYENTAKSGNVVTLPGKVTGVKQNKWWRYALVVDAAWDKQTGVSGYEYEFRNGKNKKIKSEVLKYNSNSMSQPIKNNMLYTLKVRAYTELNGKTYWGAWSDVAYLFTQPEVSKASISGGKLNISWKKITGVTGYDIYVSTNQKTGYKKVASVSAKKSSATVKKFKGKKFNSKKKYYVYVAAKKKVGKKTYNSGVNYITPIIKGKMKSGLNYI